MTMTPSTDLPLGTLAPTFHLPDTEGTIVGLDGRPDAKAYLIAFISNHCPYVKHLSRTFAALTREYMEKGVAVYAIMSNDVSRYPDDRPELMKKEKADLGYPFPYLYDESQSVARAYQAECTPEFYLFDQAKRLVYHGQMDDTRPGKGHPHGRDLRAALDAVLTGAPPLSKQQPSVGCNIKWR